MTYQIKFVLIEQCFRMLTTAREKLSPAHCHEVEIDVGIKGALQTAAFSMGANHPEAMSTIIFVACRLVEWTLSKAGHLPLRGYNKSLMKDHCFLNITIPPST